MANKYIKLTPREFQLMVACIADDVTQSGCMDDEACIPVYAAAIAAKRAIKRNGLPENKALD